MTLPAFTEKGQGDTAVILLHGIGGGQAIWGDAASGTAHAISAVYHVLSVDLPGYGQSAALAPCGMVGMADHLLRLIQALSAGQPVVLLGHSLGSMLAQDSR